MVDCFSFSFPQVDCSFLLQWHKPLHRLIVAFYFLLGCLLRETTLVFTIALTTTKVSCCLLFFFWITTRRSQPLFLPFVFPQVASWEKPFFFFTVALATAKVNCCLWFFFQVATWEMLTLVLYHCTGCHFLFFFQVTTRVAGRSQALFFTIWPFLLLARHSFYCLSIS